jgi:hypothetical protein
LVLRIIGFGYTPRLDENIGAASRARIIAIDAYCAKMFSNNEPNLIVLDGISQAQGFKKLRKVSSWAKFKLRDPEYI